MTDANEPPELLVKPEETEFKKTSLSRTLLSLAAFIAVDYWIFKSWFAVLLLVTVVFIHELGHFIAMKIFGYKSVNMTFVPFVGAYVSGKTSNLSRINKLIVLLAGPLPGIIIGCSIFYGYQHNADPLYRQIALPFLLLNVFNLLPVFPLDGGQFFQTLFFEGSRIIQLLFLKLSFGILIYLFFDLDYAWVVLLIAFPVLLRIGQVNAINKVRKKLDEEGFDYACSYDDLTDEEYWHLRAVIINANRVLRKKYDPELQSDNEQPIIKYVESILVPGYKDDLTVIHTILFALVWAAALIVPVLQWLLFKDYL